MAVKDVSAFHLFRGNCTMAFVNGTVLKVLVAVANSTLHSLNGTKVNVTATASYNITNSTNNPMCWDVPSELNGILLFLFPFVTCSHIIIVCIVDT